MEEIQRKVLNRFGQSTNKCSRSNASGERWRRREAKAEAQDVLSPKEGNHQGHTHEQVAKEIIENERQEVIKTGQKMEGGHV